MLAAFLGLGVGLQAVAGFVQHRPDRAGADRMTAPGQSQGQLPSALASPAEGRLRITAHIGIDQSVECGFELGIAVAQAFTTSARSAHPPIQHRGCSQLLQRVMQGLS